MGVETRFICQPFESMGRRLHDSPEDGDIYSGRQCVEICDLNNDITLQQTDDFKPQSILKSERLDAISC